MCLGIIDPLSQRRSAIDHIDRQPLELILIRKIAPDFVIGIEPSDRLEGQRLKPPRAEDCVVVEPAFRMNHQAVAQRSRVLVKGRREPSLP